MRTPVISRVPACAIKPVPVDSGGIERGKAVGEIGDAARQEPRRVKREGQRHDTFGGPAAECDLQPALPVMQAGMRTEPAVSLPNASKAEPSSRLTPAPLDEPPTER